MEYKALMLDIDGTVIPYSYDSLPSQKVKDAVRKALERNIFITLVTGRSFKTTSRILDSLHLKEGFAVVDGGAIVYDLTTKKPVYEQYLAPKDIKRIIEYFKSMKAPLYAKDESSRQTLRDHLEPITPDFEPKNVSMFYTYEHFTLSETHSVMKELSSPTLNIVRNRHKDPQKYGFNITHVRATKLHGMQTVCERLNLKKKEIIGIGDGYNDFPLLMASGLKVAMGNAIDELKEVADVIAPSVEDDGVAAIIEKYILS